MSFPTHHVLKYALSVYTLVGMSEVQPLRIHNPVASNVRAELARRGIKISHLERLVGQNTAYWGRRDRGQKSYDADDLIALADLIGVPAGVFFEGTEKPSADESNGGRPVRRQGLEPRTRYISASASQDGIARIVTPDSDPEPTDSGSEYAEILRLPVWRNQPGVARTVAKAAR